MDQVAIKAVARKIFTAHQNRERFCPLKGADQPEDFDTAYQIQDELYKIMQSEGDCGSFGGHKIALTSPDIQEMCGIDQPAYGSIFDVEIHQSNHNAALADFIRIGVEFEVAFEIAADVPLTDAPFDRYTIGKYVKSVMPALELIDDRDADYNDLDAKSILTDKCWCGGIVLGKPISDWQLLDLGNLVGTVHWNGELADVGNTGNALGHPLNGLAWIANHLAERGGALTKGQVIMTGSALKTRFPKAGDQCTYSIAGLGEVSAKLT